MSVDIFLPVLDIFLYSWSLSCNGEGGEIVEFPFSGIPGKLKNLC